MKSKINNPFTNISSDYNISKYYYMFSPSSTNIEQTCWSYTFVAIADGVAPHHELTTSSSVIISHVCGDDSFTTSAVSTVNAQLDIQLVTLCGGTLHCVSSLLTHECKKDNSQSVIVFKYKISISLAAHFGNDMHSQSYLKVL